MFKVLLDISLKLKQLRNYAVETTMCVKSADKKHYKKLNYKHIINEVKKEFESTYSWFQEGISNATIKKHVDSFNAIILKNKKVDGDI